MNILFFSSSAYYDLTSVPESIVAKHLHKSNCTINYLQCSGILSSHCMAMSSVDFDDTRTKSKICHQCRNKSSRLRNYYKEFNYYFIDNFVNIGEVNELAEYLFNNCLGDYLNISFDGFEIGKYAFYEFSLNHKVLNTKNLSSNLLAEYYQWFRNTLIVFFAINEYLNLIKTDRVVVYNALYSVNRIVMQVALSRGISTFSLNAGHHTCRDIMLETLTIYKGIDIQVKRNKHSALSIYRRSPVPASSFQVISDFHKSYYSARSPFIYSIPTRKLSSNDIRSFLSIRDNQKVILALTRSMDEVAASLVTGQKLDIERGLFDNIFDWMNWLNIFCRHNKDYYVIFRMHPREFPNKRESKQSSTADQMMNFLASFKAESNFHVNLPSDQLSISDLFKITDLILNNSSSSPLQGMLMGIPSLGYGEHFVPFDPLLQIETNSFDEYENYIRQLAHKGWSFETVIMANRWINYLLTEVNIDISEFYSAPKLTHGDSRIHRKIDFIIRKIKSFLTYPLPEGLIESSLKCSNPNYKLVYSIINDQSSHIGCFEPSEGDSRSETLFIARLLNNMVNLIANNDDYEFQYRIKALSSRYMKSR